MNYINIIKKAYTEEIKTLESGYFHREKDAMKKLITTFEQEYLTPTPLFIIEYIFSFGGSRDRDNETVNERLPH